MEVIRQAVHLFFVLCACSSSSSSPAAAFSTSGDRGARRGERQQEGMDLLQAIPVPFNDPKHLYFADGDPSGSASSALAATGPAFGVRAGSNIRAPFALIHKQVGEAGRGGGGGGIFQGQFVVYAHFKPADEQVRGADAADADNADTDVNAEGRYVCPTHS